MSQDENAIIGLAIRDARREDLGDIYNLVRSQAEHHGLLDEFVATMEDLEAALFSSSPKVYCDVAEVDCRVSGIAIWYYTYSTFTGRSGIHLEDLFVDDKHRTGRVMRALMQNLAVRAARESLGRVEWLIHVTNRVASTYAVALGADPMQGWMPWRWTGGKLAQGADFFGNFRNYKNNLRATSGNLPGFMASERFDGPVNAGRRRSRLPRTPVEMTGE